MEVEFLSNVRYNLFVSKQEWEEWHGKLGRFTDYFGKASKLPLESQVTAPSTPTYQPSPNLTPTSPSRAPKLPSPPTPSLPMPQHYIRTPSQPPVAGIRTKLSPIHAQTVPEVSTGSKKRPLDSDVVDHPAKRIATTAAANNPSMVPSSHTSYPPMLPSTISASKPRAIPVTSVPQLCVPTTTTVPSQMSSQALPAASTAPIGPPSLGSTSNQLPPVSRAISMMYPSTNGWNQRTPPASTLAPLPPCLPGLQDPSRRQSPFPPATTTASPAVSAYPAAAHTPTRLSPASILDRNSPYRPVRAVNTLLYPPPSTSLHHSRTLSHEQMHYQPLGKASTERKSGILPYLSQDSWSDPRQLQPIMRPDFTSYQLYRHQ